MYIDLITVATVHIGKRALGMGRERKYIEDERRAFRYLNKYNA